MDKIIRSKPHVLSDKEEKIIAMQSEYSGTMEQAFSALTNIDLDFGTIATPEGNIPLTQSTYSSLLLNPDREIRAQAYHQFHSHFAAHKNTLATLYQGSVARDVVQAKQRNFPSARSASLFNDDVPTDVYDNLIQTVHQDLPAVHDYYRLRKDVLKIDTLCLYDLKIPLLPNISTHHTYEAAVDIVLQALQPLGEEYCNVLQSGLLGNWVDRFENRGKRSGAFSAGSYCGDPYILLNYKENVLDDVFTLAHEAGHSMHSWYSCKNNPFQNYQYTIFVAEVASTFNEQLLHHYLTNKATDPNFKSYLLNKQIDATIGTVIRQTMFAEFEHLTHQMHENNQPLTVDTLKTVYLDLLKLYFGPEVEIPEESAIEGLRIPHFYSAFYVYKYATGFSAAVALSQKVLTGDAEALTKFLHFLKSGGSKYPLDQLAEAGVDMRSPAPIATTLKLFKQQVAELKILLNR